MKTYKKSLAVLALVLTVSGASIAFAQDDGTTTTPPFADDSSITPPFTDDETCITHDEVSTLIAEALDMTVEDVEAAHEASTSKEEFAEALGITVEELEAITADVVPCHPRENPGDFQPPFGNPGDFQPPQQGGPRGGGPGRPPRGGQPPAGDDGSGSATPPFGTDL